ncbi:kyphoscoliosis peptidase-like [Phaenicophaeus curvirostris]|uniref:kyphoscoliosis peptidase-like n=1 Tax=Phaenicophaeus curvirostris TaxID=33595 RepID=UPI0037F0BC3A
MKTSYDRGKSTKSQTIKAKELIPSHSSRNGNHHEKQTTQSTLRWVHPKNHEETMMTSWAENISPGWEEAQMSDVCNGDFPLGHISEEIGCKTSEKLPHQATNTNRNKKQVLKEISATQEVREEPKASPSKGVFAFWAEKVNSSSERTFQKLLQKSSVIVSSSSPALLPKEGLNSLEEKQTKNPQRKTRRDLFSDSKVFSHVDTHVLHVSQQLKSRHAGLSVHAIVPLITARSRSKLEMVRAIWFWLCHNIEYDVDGFLGFSQKIHVPEQVLQTGRAVCSGYAHLCQEMCREAGLSCVKVPGFGRSPSSSGGRWCQQQKSSHMWNAVELEGQWCLLDACWGAGIVDAENRVFMPRYDDFFFLTDPEHFIETHWPEDPQWQLLQPPISREDFEQRVFKTSEFFRLQLSLLSPNTSLLKTAHGEVSVMLGSTHPTEFTYQLSRLQGTTNGEDVGTVHGMMTVSENNVTIKVTPPTQGLFDLMIFARHADSQDPYNWVCSYQIQCLEPHNREELPENPFHFWGLHQKVRDLGIEESSHKEELLIAPQGTLLLALLTSRPLLATYELVNKDLDAALSKKCLAAQAEEEKLSCHVLCPFQGYYRLSVFVKDLGGNTFRNAANFLIRCLKPVNQNELFPSGLSIHCGSGISSRDHGLSNPSHSSPIITTKLGKCNITFHTPPDVELTASLSKDKVINAKYPLERYILVTHLRTKVSVCVVLPESGVYKMGLFGRSKEHKDFTHICDYVVRCFSDPSWPPFPRVYSLWRRGCVLLEPRTGLLQDQTWVRFRVKVPKAYQIVILGEEKTVLQQTPSMVWEGDVFTGAAGTQVKLAAKFSQHCSFLEVILAFEVGGGSPASLGWSG